MIERLLQDSTVAFHCGLRALVPHGAGELQLKRWHYCAVKQKENPTLLRITLFGATQTNVFAGLLFNEDRMSPFETFVSTRKPSVKI